MLTPANPCALAESRGQRRLYTLLPQCGTFTDLFHRQQPRIYQLCLYYLGQPADAEDATMEVFERLVGYLSADKPVLHLTSWLHQVTRNHCLRRMELKVRRKRAILQFQKTSDWCVRPGNGNLTADKRLETLYTGIGRLSRTQRDCLLRFYFEEQPYKEIAARLGLSAGEVKSHIQNGKRNLRKFMLAWESRATDF